MDFLRNGRQTRTSTFNYDRDIAMHKVKIQFENDSIDLDVEGDLVTGLPEVMLATDDDLTEHTHWKELGYVIAPFLTAELQEQLHKCVRNIIHHIAEGELGRAVPVFELVAYHRQFTDQEHLRITEVTRKGVPRSWLPFDPVLIERRLSEIVGLEVVLDSPFPENELDFIFRIVRPRRFIDNNPPHRDVYLKNIRHNLNIYAPLCGSDSRSSLPLIPGSHRLPESDIERTNGITKVFGVKYSVPCITAIQGDPVRMVRPNPKEGEVMVFSPYMVHGGGYNFNTEATRVSLEMRFWRKEG
jgi:hypothetical protein